MSLEEIGVVIGGAFIGFWIVGAMMSSTNKKTANQSQFYDSGNVSNAQHRNDQTQDQHQFSESQKNRDILPEWYDVLEIPPTATKDQIISAYKKKISQYHPDKVANMGQELRELAELKSKQINSAYDRATKLRG